RVAARGSLFILLLAAAAVTLARWLTAAGRLPEAAWPACAIGLGVAAFSAVTFLCGAAATAGRGLVALLAAVVLGMLGRLVIYGGTLVYVARQGGADLAWTAGSLVGASAILLIPETRFAIAGLEGGVRAVEAGQEKGKGAR